MKPVQALLPTSRTKGAPSSPCRVRAPATICCDRPGNPCVLDDETMIASSSSQGRPRINSSSSPSPTVTGDCSGAKKRRDCSPVFASISSARSVICATIWADDSSSISTPSRRRRPISRLEITSCGSVLPVATMATVALNGGSRRIACLRLGGRRAASYRFQAAVHGRALSRKRAAVVSRLASEQRPSRVGEQRGRVRPLAVTSDNRHVAPWRTSGVCVRPGTLRLSNPRIRGALRLLLPGARPRFAADLANAGRARDDS